MTSGRKSQQKPVTISSASCRSPEPALVWNHEAIAPVFSPLNAETLARTLLSDVDASSTLAAAACVWAGADQAWVVVVAGAYGKHLLFLR